ncbi:MAG: hypothetical protein HZT41_15065 [Dechloromonas sp.]|nr:MAG: hypothetical protein HZT41_15065 [Dechloromonas sp.]
MARDPLQRRRGRFTTGDRPSLPARTHGLADPPCVAGDDGSFDRRSQMAGHFGRYPVNASRNPSAPGRGVHREAVEKRPTEVGHERVRIRTGSTLYHKPHSGAIPQYQCRHLRRINQTSIFDQSGKYPDSNAQESPGRLFAPYCAPFPASGQHRKLPLINPESARHQYQINSRQSAAKGWVPVSSP